MKTPKMAISFLISLVLPAISQDFWQQTSGPYGGRIASLVINSNGDIFAGTRGSAFWILGNGVYRSVDKGDSWQRIYHGLEYDGWPHLNISSLAAGLNGIIFAGASGGLYRSTDNGDTWTLLTGMKDQSIGPIAISANGDVYASIIQLGGGVYRSTDNGDTWTQVGNVRADAIAINSNGDIFAGGWGVGVYRSTDNGASWTLINQGLTYLQVVESLAINSGGCIFAGTNDGGVYRSTDNGDTWIQINNGLVDYRVLSLAINSGGIFLQDMEFGAYPAQPITVILGHMQVKDCHILLLETS